FKKFWPADVHVIGKGILRFHAVYWPAILLSASLRLPKSIFVHGYITVEGQKMSKTLGNIVDPIHLIEKYGVDPLRYFLLSGISTFEDGDFSERLLIEKNNNELVANIGNLVNRTMVFSQNNFGSAVPKQAVLSASDKDFLGSQEKLLVQIKSGFESFRLDETLHRILSFSSGANKYFQENAPWKSVKEDKVRCGHVINLLLHQIKDLAILIQPYLPETSNSIFGQLAAEPKKWTDLGKFSLVAGKKLGTPKILFKKLDQIQAEALSAEFSDKKLKELEVAFQVSNSAAALGVKAAAAILEIKSISNKNSELETLKKQKFKLEDSGYVQLHRKVSAEEMSSIRWLHELASRAGQIPNINTLVDAYNIISLKYGISAGAHDISKIKGGVRIDICDGSEPFTEIGSKSKTHVRKGEYAAIDDEKVICRLELKQCEETKVKKDSKKVLLYYEGHSGHTQDQVNTALKEACNLIIKLCGGSYKMLYPAYEKEEENFSFKHLDIEIGEILSAEKHPNADKLLVERVRLGDKEIQVVSGIAQFYKPEDLAGKKAIFLRNLKPATLRGVASQGMILVAESKDKSKVEIVSPASPVGSKVELKGEVSQPKPEVTADDYFKLKLEIKDGKIYSEGKQLITETGEELKTGVKEGKVY
ncbi:class I tRNA ligase family protein, partial [Candidatus Micrarchaeota archaeon]|nr:class I tRNA ligase family protein [Candidatus Micrarchaeota archaeon]